MQPAAKRPRTTTLSVPLAKFITAMNNFDPKKTPVSSIDELEGLLVQGKVHPLGFQRTKQVLQMLASYQFSPTLYIRELTANGLDSYFYDANLAASLPPGNRIVSVRTDDVHGKIVVEDNGVGMELHTLVFYLLAPTRSHNNAVLDSASATDGVTGRFGQGFFSVLSLLKTDQDSIVVNTKTINGSAYLVCIRKKSNEYVVDLSVGRRSTRGTQIEINTSLLNFNSSTPASKTAFDVLSKYFAYNHRGVVLLNNLQINTLSGVKMHSFTIPGKPPQSASVFTQGYITEGVGKLILLVNGIMIKEFYFPGFNIHELIVIDLPISTELTPDRSAIDLKNSSNRTWLDYIARNAFDRGLYIIFNSVYPLFGPDYASISPTIVARPEMIPAVRQLQGLSQIKIGNIPKTAVPIASGVFEKVRLSLPSILSTATVKIVPSVFLDKNTRMKFAEINNNIYVFLDENIDINNENVLPLINAIYKVEQEKNGADLTAFAKNLFTSSDIQKLLDKSQRQESSEKIWESILAKLSPKCLKRLFSKAQPRDEIVHSLNSIINYCTENDIPHCADIVVSSYTLIKKFFGQDIDLADKTKLRPYLYFLSLHWPSEPETVPPNWNKDLHWENREEVLINSLKNISMEEIALTNVARNQSLKNLFFNFCLPIGVPEAGALLLSKEFIELFNDSITQQKLAKFIDEFTIYDINKSLPKDKLLAEITPILDPDLLPIIYNVLFGNSVSFSKAGPYAGDSPALNLLLPVEQHQLIREVIGADESVIAKNYKKAAQQNFQPTAWIKEVIKNAVEAQSDSFHLNVSKNEKQELLVEVRDFGTGVHHDNMHFFYIPDLTSKARNTEDINFGWGFFTIFKFFDEVVIETSIDGIHKKIIRLAKDNNLKFFIAESEEPIVDLSFAKGTKLSLLRSNKAASGIDPVLIKANLLRYMQGYPDLKVQFNNKPLEGIFNNIFADQPLEFRMIDDTRSLAIFSHPKGGLFLNGLEVNPSIARYINMLPAEMQEFVRKLPMSFAINLKGTFGQIANRNEFLEEEKLAGHIHQIFGHAVIKQFSYVMAKRPEIFKKLLPSDYYYDFKDTAKLNVSLGYVIALGQLAPDTQLKLVEVKDSVKEFLVKEGILNHWGFFPADAVLPDNSLKNIFPLSLSPLLQMFENKIQEQLAMGKMRKDLFQGSAFHDVKEIHELPSVFDSHKLQLEKFVELLRYSAQKYLNRDVKILFTDRENNAGSHAAQNQREGIPSICFSLKALKLNNFIKMVTEKEWSQAVYMDIIKSLTHEFVHCDEFAGQPSHNVAFYEKHQALLQKFFVISVEDIEEFKRIVF